ncbi:MAG TPA: GPW/gp25 family protein [Flavobacteriaceae bacterium]|nr:GPW/gp25 family protein [Flavobacteriaceae bacterium]MCB9214033.1 GPW/gp25 family protein [Alteromonas sp.]HPF10822.1 GPW/gp25 family protein [Flavobacteriaceae bacterium]HQU20969.1 GPW/gp25 family protein [Flavobacteriaceae bacterium]HQU65542.1 GPW/gp25 family protein [Flavobacteriaceae bacterium]
MDKIGKHNKKHFYGSGWSFPIAFTAGTYQLDLTEYVDNVNQSIKIILQTKKGERYLEPSLGSGLQEFFFRKMDETLKGEIKEKVSYALLINEPRITVQNVEVDFIDMELGQIQILINYLFNDTNTRHNYVFPFHLKEGTSLH